MVKMRQLGIVALLCGTLAWAGEIPAHLKRYSAEFQKDARQAALSWFRDARYGLFVHYALASLLERGKPGLIQLAGSDEVMELTGERVEVLEAAAKSNPAAAAALKIKQDLFGRFTASAFSAKELCELAEAAGMRYVTFTTSHLGRLYMFRTKVSRFTSLASPARRDLVAEMAAACRRRGLGLFLYVPPDVARTDGEYLERNRTMLRELLTQYGPIAGVWFDGIGDYNRNPANYAKLSETYAMIRSLQPHCLISFKEGALGEEDFRSPEHFLLPAPYTWKNSKTQQRWKIRLDRWQRQHLPEREKRFHEMPAEINTVMQECANRDGVGEPGGWINDEQARHLSAGEVMDLVHYARTMRANLLLNIGPRGDGSIHPDDARTLREVGRRIRESGLQGGARGTASAIHGQGEW